MPVYEGSGPYLFVAQSTSSNYGGVQEGVRHVALASPSTTSRTLAFGTNTTLRWLKFIGTGNGGSTTPGYDTVAGDVVWFQPSDIDASPNARRITGDINFTIVISNSAADAGGTGTLRVYAMVARVSDGAIVSQIGTVTSAGFSLALAGNREVNMTIPLPNGFVVPAGHTIAFGIWCQARGVGITGQTIGMIGTAAVGGIPTGNPTSVTLAAQGLRYQYSQALSSALALAAALRPFVHGKTYASTTLLTAVKGATALTRSFASGLALVPTYARRLTFARSAASGVTLVPTRQPLVVLLRTFSSAIPLVPTRQPFLIRKVAAATIPLIPTMTRLLGKNAASGITLTPVFSRALQFRRSFTSGLALVSTALLQIPQVVLNRITGSGGTTIIRKIINIFDD